jgi:hypothetical protein
MATQTVLPMESKALHAAFKRINNDPRFSLKRTLHCHDDFHYVDCPHDDYMDNVPDDDD